MVFVTAEIGSHWQGDFSVLESILRSCSLGGIDAVKFQCLSEEKIKRHPELPYYRKSSINSENIAFINDLCKIYNIEWYATPTLPEHVDLLNPYVNRFKIGTLWSNDKELCDKVFSTGKQVIISSEKPLRFDNKMIKNLYCIPKYPTEFSEINFNVITEFNGYSNHCLNALAILRMVAMDAQYIEFHITPTKEFFLLDNRVSFNFFEMLELMRWIRIYEHWNNPTSPINVEEVSKQSSKQSKQ